MFAFCRKLFHGPADPTRPTGVAQGVPGVRGTDVHVLTVCALSELSDEPDGENTRGGMTGVHVLVEGAVTVLSGRTGGVPIM